jgi:hypothetical protein
MENHARILGHAKRIRVRLPLGGFARAWDCRPFGFGRIVAPVAHGRIEIVPHVELDLASGKIQSQPTWQKRSA